jgi:hypothetical protein
MGEVGRGVLSRLTFDPHNDIYAVWSLTVRSSFWLDRDGVFNIYESRRAAQVKKNKS